MNRKYIKSRLSTIVIFLYIIVLLKCTPPYYYHPIVVQILVESLDTRTTRAPSRLPITALLRRVALLASVRKVS